MYPQKRFDFGPKGRTGCHESFCTVARCYDFFGALLLRFLWCVYSFWQTGKMGAPRGWYGEDERTKPLVLKLIRL